MKTIKKYFIAVLILSFHISIPFVSREPISRMMPRQETLRQRGAPEYQQPAGCQGEDERRVGRGGLRG